MAWGLVPVECVCMCACVCMCVFVCMCGHLRVGICTWLGVCVCICVCAHVFGFPGGSDGKASSATQETQVRSLSREDPLEKEMAAHASALAWKIPWTEEPGGLQSMGSRRVGHD